MRYDPATQQLTAAITDAETGTNFMVFARTVASFPTNTTRLGVSRLHMKGGMSGVDPSAIVDYNLDNIQLYAQEMAPGLALPLANSTVPPGGTAQISTRAFGTQPLSYQWYFNGSALPATGPSLMVTNASSSQDGTYCVVISNAICEAPIWTCLPAMHGKHAT